MTHEFWQNKWTSNDIGFHMAEANELLVKYFDQLKLPRGKRIFVPLCGKTLDIHWLLQQGYHIVGSELVEIAVAQLFNELNVTPSITALGEIKRYSAPNIDIYVGDIFKLTGEILGYIDAIYDRAALVALPKELRVRYTKHLKDITRKAPQLIICFEYDEKLHEGPPFSITAEEIRAHYAQDYSLRLLESEQIPDGLKGKYPSLESVWLLT